MFELFTLGLIVAVVLLWRRVERLQIRIGILEGDGSVRAPQPMVADKPKPAVIVRGTVPSAEPAPSANLPQQPPPPEPQPASQPKGEPAPLQTPAPQATAATHVPRISFEELFGSRLPIWGGGITLAVAGLFIVKYSIDQGLLSPLVRVLFGLAFALALVAGAEVARRWKATAIDPRVAQALAGAGIAAAYADILMATNLYHLISQLVGFLGLAAVTAGALGLALRFGSPAALLGLIGGLAAPALVGERSATIAPLTVYLVLVVAGLSAVARRQRWPWLSIAALVGGFGWGGVLLLLEPMRGQNGLALGGYAILLALAIPLLAHGLMFERTLRLGAAIAGTVQLGLVVASGGFALLHWGLYGLLSIAVIVLARIDTRQAPMPLLALGVGLVTLLGWHAPPPADLKIVIIGAVLIFAGPALFDNWRSRGSWRSALQAALALVATIWIARAIAPGALTASGWGWVALLFALPLLLSAGWRVRRGLAANDRRFAILTTATALTVAGGLALIVQHRWLALLYAVLLCGLVELWRRGRTLDYRGALGVTLAAVLIALLPVLAQWGFCTLFTIAGMPVYTGDLPRPVDALLLLLPSALLGIALWRRELVRPWPLLVAVPAVIAAAGLFIVYKQLFGIEGASDFVTRGLAERVLLDQLLFAAAWLAWRERSRWVGLQWAAMALAAVALGRVLFYNVLIFNPIWRDQLVGVLPLANLLAPAYLFAVGWLWWSRRAMPAQALPVVSGVQMVLILVYAAATVRQAFHGALIAVGGVGQSESFAFSAAAVLIALGFLRWGIHRRDRTWRLASLVLMLATVAKVFLSDAAGLDGLLRIASFVGLGLSLIGIGWLYSRHVGADQVAR